MKKRSEKELSFLFLTGISTRSLSMLSKKLIGIKVSPSEVSRANRQLIEAVEQWRTRELGEEAITYLFIDGVSFPMRITKSIERVPVLVCIGVNQKGQKKVLGFLQSGDKESATSWREFFKDIDTPVLTHGVLNYSSSSACPKSSTPCHFT